MIKWYQRNELYASCLVVPEHDFVILGQALLLEAVNAAQTEVLVVTPVQEHAVGAHRHEQKQQDQHLRGRSTPTREPRNDKPQARPKKRIPKIEV